MHLTCISLVYISFVFFINYGHLQMNIDGPKVSSVIRDMLDSGLKVADFQAYLNSKVNYTVTNTNGTVVRDYLLNGMRDLLQIQVDAVHKLAAVVSEMYSPQADDPTQCPECCKVVLKDSDFAETLNSKVDQTKMCYTRPSPVKVPYPLNDSAAQSLQTAFVANKNSMQLLDYQYFGSESGVFYIYPAYRGIDCYNLDSRTRPWYSQTYNKYDRDLVIVLDMSTNMSLAMFDDRVPVIGKALEAAQMIVNAASSKDRIAIIPFGVTVEVKSYDSCFATELTFASERVRTNAKQFLASLKPSNVGTYATAIGNAFKILHDKNEANRSSAVIFIVGSVSADSFNDRLSVSSDVLQYSWLDAKPLFITYILGNSSAVYADVQTTLSLFSNILEPTIIGKSTDIIKIALSFFRAFPAVSANDTNTAQFTPPFVDFTNKGYVTVITQPVFSQGTFIGVVGIHVALAAFTTVLSRYNMRETSYLFLFDLDNSNTLMHPLIPPPIEQGVNAQLVNISLLEQALPSSILQNITRGVTGSFEGILIPRYNPIGTYQYGEKVEIVNSSYHCARMDIDSIHWQFCIVLAQEDKTVTRVVKQNYRALRFFYHRLDLGEQDEEAPYTCQILHTITIAGITTVKFAPKSYLNPSVYLYLYETKDSVRKLINVIKRKKPNDILVNAAIDDVWHTTYINDRWSADILGIDEVPYAVRRYIGTDRGMLRVYPVAVILKNYDPTARPWYKSATSMKGQSIITTPYLDAFGAGYVLTLATTVYEYNPSLLFGVMGIDLTVGYLYLRVETEFMKDCSKDGFSCFIMDRAGYIITHPSWYLTDYTGYIQMEDVHVTEYEPAIAKHMISKGFLVRSGCTNILNIRQETFYQGNVSGTRDEQIQGGYMIVEAPLTNVYIVLKINALTNTGDCCHPTGVKPQCQLDDNMCECPCFKQVKFKPCTLEFDVNEWLPCPPPPKSINLVSDKPVVAYIDQQLTLSKDLDHCAVQSCHTVPELTEWSCTQIYYCRWCTHTKAGKLLEKSFCGDYDQCWFGQVGRDAPDAKKSAASQKGGSSSLHLPLIIGLVVAASIIALVIIGVTLWQMKVRRFACFKKDKSLKSV